MSRLMRSASGGWLRRCRRGACRVTAVESIYHFDSAAGPNNVPKGIDHLTVSRQRDVLVAENGGAGRGISYETTLPFSA